MTQKIVHVIGGGTVSHVRTHLALCAPAYGATARRLAELCRAHNQTMEVKLHLTKMADPTSALETTEDVRALTKELVRDMRTKIIFFNPAICDFDGEVADVASGKRADRLRTSNDTGNLLEHGLRLKPAPKILRLIRKGVEEEPDWKPRKDIFLVSFKATCNAAPEEQYRLGLESLKKSSSNLVLANDVGTRRNMIIVPEEGVYDETMDREEALKKLVEMAYFRSHLTFTHSTVKDGKAVPWESPLVPASLRAVVDYCIARGAYKKFLGVTAGHFAVKIDDTHFLSSIRKTDYNDLKNVGLVKIETDGPDTVIAYGFKPSVGGQSQRIVFGEHPDIDCIVHFHCPIKEGSRVPVVSQREYECGSHECGENTSRGMERFGNLWAVHLDHHGPNIGFRRSVDPQEVIDLIEANFDLTKKTGGYEVS